MTTFDLPDLGEGLTEATLLSWLVEEGEEIVVDQPIAEVETAKSAVEVPSPYAGVVKTLHGAVGDTLIVDEPLITVDTGDGADSAGAGAQSYREEERAGTDPSAADEADDEGSGNVLIGYGTSSSAGGRRRRRRGGGRGSEAPAPASEPAAAAPEKAPRVSSPLVRKLARQHGLALSSLSGSGPDGLIVRADVLAAAEAGGTAEAPAARGSSEYAAAPQAGTGAQAPGGLEIVERTPVTGMRRAVATKLSQSRREIPEATVWQDVDVTELMQMRAKLKATSAEGAPSILAFVGRFVLAGLAKYPELAARLDTDESGEQEIVRFDGVNLGFAAQTEKGLVVPVIRHAERLSARGLHAEIGRIVGEARDGTLSGKELTGGTFTVNNYGVFGSDGATPIINHPEVGILGMGRILERPWAMDGELAVRQVTTLTLAFDHRVCDGGTAGGFLNFVATCLQNPAGALADM
ncbi:MAG: dihydrolipoamide acetyltransferase family protein [Nesterenkonia sp.]|uniref:dihydrolipoamide acetyltransferase family protein n=1 Tax=Nesterenkonia marinintestina TaxID=2979865 RepID=UPI0021BFE661|nr:dihydrolipoamide acetyltransferase family protein [Nesterenkonia sp. GX14115]MDO5492371.1 dihydrolipoamide acetyltransferase family protein [Nesterenkonia sp.]